MYRVTVPLCTLTLAFTMATLAMAVDQAAPATPPHEAKVEIIDWTNRLSASKTHQYVVGTVRNIGLTTATYVRIKIQALDTNERLVSVHEVLADPSTLEPGTEGTLSLPIRDSDEIEYFSVDAHWQKVAASVRPEQSPRTKASATSTTDGGSAALGLFLLAMIALAYILPGLVANSRSHHNKGAIWALTLLAGWTAIGWLVAFVWSLTAVKTPALPQVLEERPAA